MFLEWWTNLPRPRVQLYTTLQKVFGHSEFRPGQLDAAVNAIHGRDVFVQMSTGAGKTLCMFLPPLAMSESSVGVFILSMLSWMSRYIRVTILGFVHQLFFLSVKIFVARVSGDFCYPCSY